MGRQSDVLPEHAAGVYERSAPALVMVGHWALSFEITPPGQQPFTLTLVDRTAG
jgi:copper transport protein